MRIYLKVVVLLAVASLLLPASAWAGKRSLWGGLVSFNVPAKAVVEEADIDGWDDAYLVRPRSQAQKAAALIVREKLSTDDAAKTTAQLAEQLKQDFKNDGLRVSKWNLKSKKQQVTGSLSGNADVPWSRKPARTIGTFRVIRVYKDEVVGVLAFTAPREIDKPYAKPYQQIVNTFSTPRPPKPKKRKP